MGQQGVAKREDSWVEVPATRDDGFKMGPVQLRVGGDETKIRLRAQEGGVEQEVEIRDLREGISLIEEEHAR